MRACAILLCACLFVRPAVAAAAPRAAGVATDAPVPAQQPEVDGVTRLVLGIEAAIRDGDDAGLRALARPDMNRARLSEFALSMTLTKVSDLTVKERDRTPLANGGQRLLLEILTVTEGEGRVWTWRMDVLPKSGGDSWLIADAERLTVVTGLYRLSLEGATEWEVQNAVINAPDLTLSVASGYAFTAQVPGGPTAIVIVGRGEAVFAPGPASERGQLRIFSGAEVLRTQFTTLFIRVSPAEFAARVSEGALKPRPVAPRDLRRATQIFDSFVSRTFQINLNDLSTAAWSLIPSAGDFVAEIGTRKYGPLTYARSTSEPEDVSFFDRRRRRNIAVYASAERAAAHGRFFSEDDHMDFEVTHYDLDTSVSPDRMWVDGVATLTVRARSTLTGTMTVRLAEPLVVRSVLSSEFGRLLHLRVVGQNNVLVGLPGSIPEGTEFHLTITYGGRLPPQSVDREAITMQQPDLTQDIMVPLEPQWTYSNRSYWYPQATVTQYATATLAITVPSEYDVVASGVPQGSPAAVPPTATEQRARKRFVFDSAQPLRYLAFAVSRFQFLAPATITLQDAPPISLFIAANPRQGGRARQIGEKAADIVKFYGSLLDEAPYAALTLAVEDGDLPGGHSPAYLALLSQPLPTTPYVWSNDPVSFPTYPSFFVAHEVAHQWWGQGVGWKNYHEQWLSEGFAQYFAALYAEKERGPETFTSVIRQMRRWAIDMSPQGPVYLGYRLGHIRGEGRVFRAVVYNKGAMALHMLRRLLGDEAFFAGLRDFYATWRYKKAGTDDLRAAMEKASGGQPLERFFDRWIYGSGIPTVRLTSTTQGGVLTVRLEQRSPDIYDAAIAVTVNYVDGTSQDVLVRMTDRVAEARVELKKAVKSVEANRDGGALVDIEK